ncbi:unnamed protein product [Ostreobium quekettii]|uniref:HTTM-like domain-containing protein n=1 Tax=Ostreobium quekettii TaxID=121088 RepID=A0A8S1IRX9_9CHLO|nr:unnamed protein product [Ostreobium quekettii]|eukprot:evm.model.scf_603.7 EVM.evm.TU.scf_603.7   scf_603:37258-44674(-)
MDTGGAYTRPRGPGKEKSPDPEGLKESDALLGGRVPAKPASPSWSDRADRLFEWLDRPVHASTLCLFRVLYSFVMFTQFTKWWNMFDHFQGTAYTLPYPGVGWIKPVSPAVGNAMLLISVVASLFLCVGLLTRITAVVLYINFAIIFHHCHSYFNNHYVLMCHICFLAIFVNWNQWLSVDSILFFRQRPKNAPITIPFWNLLIFRLIFCVPYFFGGIAKLNSDWLFRAQPLKDWFTGGGPLLEAWWFPWFIAETGVMFDLVISFLLFYRPTRYLLGFPAALVFNISNKFIFNIGVFPLAMITSLVLFIPAHLPAAIVADATGAPSPLLPPDASSKDEDSEMNEKNGGAKQYRQKASGRRTVWYRRFVLLFFCSFVAFHALYPLRHFVLYKSNPSWTEEGHIGAWHMKLRGKVGWLYFVTEETNGTVLEFAPKVDMYLNSRQAKKVLTRAHPLIIYAERLKKFFDEAGRDLKSMRVKSCFSLNVNPAKELYISTANLLDYIGKYETIGVTGVGRWIWAYADAPLCEQRRPQTEVDEINTRSRAAYKELYAGAHVKDVVERDMWGNLRRRVIYEKIDEKGRHIRMPAYMWNT